MTSLFFRNVARVMAAVALVSAISIVSSASADIITPTGWSASGGSFHNSPELSVNDSGLTMSGGDAGILTWTHSYGTDAASLKAAGNPWSVDYDLGAVYDLTGAYVWNSGNFRSQDGYEIYVSTDDVTYSALVTTGSLADNNTTQVIAFSETARYVRFGGIGAAGERSLGEIKFEGTVAGVPEPSSIALAALGLAGLGWFGIRRRKA